MKSIKDIAKKHHCIDDTGEVNIHRKNDIVHETNSTAYLEELKEMLQNTDPQSITDNFIVQYIIGGGDPNPGNIGFAPAPEGSGYKWVIAKVDLDASFKEPHELDAPDPTHNKYAFEIPEDNLRSLDDLFKYVTTYGNALMPGREYYDPSKEGGNVTYQGQGNVGLGSIRMTDFITKDHLFESLKKVVNIDFSKKLHSIGETLYKSMENMGGREKLPFSNEVEYGQYIIACIDLTAKRQGHLSEIYYKAKKQCLNKSFVEGIKHEIKGVGLFR